jgi:hypothetical protein
MTNQEALLAYDQLVDRIDTKVRNGKYRRSKIHTELMRIRTRSDDPISVEKHVHDVLMTEYPDIYNEIIEDGSPDVPSIRKRGQIDDARAIS